MYALYLSIPVAVPFDNDNSAFVPEQWAYEGLMQLEENMIAARMVHRDFEPTVANYGDTVNTRRPGEFKIRRKKDGVSLSHQDASATNVQVILNQWFYQSFVIKDGEASMAFRDLVQIYLAPSMRTIARSVDRALLGHVHYFLQFGVPTKRVGRLLNLAAATSHERVLEAREILNVNSAPVEGRNLILGPTSETALLKNELFISAEKRGDGGAALESARLGRILGFETFMGQNVPALAAGGSDVATGTITNALAGGGSGAQAGSIVGYVVNVGEFAVVAGNDQPTWITAEQHVGADTTEVTFNEANKNATAAGAAVTVYKKADVKGAYAVGHILGIVLDGWTNAPQTGQLIAFGTGANRRTYTIIESELSAAGEQTIWLDRPLEVALADNALAFPGPAGTYNLAFHRNALALVSRPLAVPNNRMGVLSGFGAYNDVAMRVSMQYDIDAGGTIVNCDILAGIAMLDDRLAVVVQG